MCDQIVTPLGTSICPECEKLLKVIRDPYCLKCGKPIEYESDSMCHDCKVSLHSFDRAFSAYEYNDAMRKSIYRFKYDGRKEYAKFYGQKMAQILSDRLNVLNADGIIPVPMHKSKEKKRGYNQAQLIAKELSNRLKIPMYDNIVERKKSTQIMRSLGAKERENNLKKAFKIVPNSVKLYDVIIVDDIYTTGSTADAVTEVLKAAGVRRVFVASLSTGRIK